MTVCVTLRMFLPGLNSPDARKNAGLSEWLQRNRAVTCPTSRARKRKWWGKEGRKTKRMSGVNSLWVGGTLLHLKVNLPIILRRREVRSSSVTRKRHCGITDLGLIAFCERPEEASQSVGVLFFFSLLGSV